MQAKATAPQLTSTRFTGRLRAMNRTLNKSMRAIRVHLPKWLVAIGDVRLKTESPM
jgi:hypothetical protein